VLVAMQRGAIGLGLQGWKLTCQLLVAIKMTAGRKRVGGFVLVGINLSRRGRVVGNSGFKVCNPVSGLMILHNHKENDT